MAVGDNVSAEMAAANKGPTILATVFAISVLCTIFTAARLYVRGRILRQFHADDWLIVFSVICIWISSGLAVKAIDHGNGRHIEVLSQEQQEAVTFWTLVGFPVGILTFGIPKLAVVAVLTRIMQPGRWHTIFMWAMAVVCNVLLAINAFFLLGRCTPAASQWNFDMEGTCWDPQILVSYAIATGVFSAFVDLYLAVYPGTVLSRLGIKRKKKIALIVALGLGCISTAVAIFKCTRLPLLAAEDFSWETADLVILNIAEGGTLIIASCIPVLQPLLRIIMKREPLATSGTPGQDGAGYQAGYQAGVHGMPYGQSPAIVLYPSKSLIRSSHRSANGSGEYLVEHTHEDVEQGVAPKGDRGATDTVNESRSRESIKMKALRRYGSIKQSVRQSVIGVAL